MRLILLLIVDGHEIKKMSRHTVLFVLKFKVVSSKDGSHIIHNFVLIYFPLLKILCRYLSTFKTAGFLLILTIRSHFYHMFFHSRKYCFISIHGKKSHFACNNRKIFESLNRFKTNFQKA